MQKQILTTAVKYYLNHPEEEEFIQKVLKMTTEECDNPDIRDRGFIYWRLLAGDQDYARSLVMAERPPISEDAGNVEADLLDPLLENIGTLASVYYQKPEQFVPKIKQKANERFDLEHTENEELQQPVTEEKKQESLKVSEEAKANVEALAGIDIDPESDAPAQATDNKPAASGGVNLLDI